MNTSVVTIIGGGLAGSAAAITLARAGASVVLLEREAKPVHKVCGEFLSEEAVDLLHALGIGPAIQQAPSIQALRLSHGHSTSRVDLPFRARSLTRRALDEAVLRQAEREGAAVIPSFTGDGMSMALHSGVLAASALLAGTDSRVFQRRYAHSVARQVRLATLLSRGMVHPVLQRCMTQAVRFQPHLLRWVATQTRLPRSVRAECLRALG